MHMDRHVCTDYVFEKCYLDIATAFCAVFKMSHTELKLPGKARRSPTNEEGIKFALNFK